MPGRNFVLAFSGGLDTSYGLAVLVDRGEHVTTVTVNTGGFDEAELQEIKQRARELGATEHIVIDGRARLYEQFVSYILKANYLRNGVYPSCVGVERMLQAEEVTRVALDRGADAIAHGSTGAGNDHVRFDAVTKALAPKLEIVGLIRDEAHTREEERDFLARARSPGLGDHRQVLVQLRHPRHHDRRRGDLRLLGVPARGGVADDEVDRRRARRAGRADDRVRARPARPAYELTGGPAVDVGGTGIGVPGYDTLAALNRIGAEHGVGRGIHTGQTIMGILGRLGFEAPGMLILIAAHRELERLVLTNAQQTAEGRAGHDVRRHAARGPLLRPAPHRHPRVPGQLAGAGHRRGADPPAQGQHDRARLPQPAQPARRRPAAGLHLRPRLVAVDRARGARVRPHLRHRRRAGQVHAGRRR